jgi:hypothetical protein
VARKRASQPETVNASPRVAPNDSTVVPASSATARRWTAGSARKTYVPAGAGTSSPSSVNVADPRATKYISSWPLASSVCGSTTSSPAACAT